MAPRPSDLVIQARKPCTGCIIMFFHTSAETVGMMKNGAITNVKVTYTEDFATQMLNYSKNYSFLPAR